MRAAVRPEPRLHRHSRHTGRAWLQLPGTAGREQPRNTRQGKGEETGTKPILMACSSSSGGRGPAWGSAGHRARWGTGGSAPFPLPPAHCEDSALYDHSTRAGKQVPNDSQVTTTLSLVLPPLSSVWVAPWSWQPKMGRIELLWCWEQGGAQWRLDREWSWHC